MKHLKITVGDVSFRAKLNYETAPGLAKIFEECLPLEGKANHAKVCDNEFFIQAPFFKDEKENPVFPEAGKIGYFPVRQTICLWYDETKPLGPSTILATIYPEDRAKCAAECSKIWRNPGVNVKYEIAEG